MLDQIQVNGRFDRAGAVKTATEESNHRIANNLVLVGSLVRMKANAVLKHGDPLEPREAAGILKEIAERIDGVAKLHRMLSSGASQDQVVAGPYLSEVCNGVARSFTTDQDITFRDESDALALAPEQLNAFGLFLAEALTNAFKHSHPAGAPGRIEVVFGLGGRPQIVRLAVQDDGVGLPEGFNPKTDGGLGMRIMRSLSEQLGGVLSVKADPLGLVVGVEAPLLAKAAVNGR